MSAIYPTFSFGRARPARRALARQPFPKRRPVSPRRSLARAAEPLLILLLLLVAGLIWLAVGAGIMRGTR